MISIDEQIHNLLPDGVQLEQVNNLNGSGWQALVRNDNEQGYYFRGTGDTIVDAISNACFDGVKIGRSIALPKLIEPAGKRGRQGKVNILVQLGMYEAKVTRR